MEKYRKPIHLPEYYIYDIFHNDNNNLIIIASAEIPILDIYCDDNNDKKKMNVHKCPHNHTYVYYVEIDYKNKITLNINNKIITTTVNKYEEFNDQIIFSTLVKDENDYMIQWIEYHKNIGISNFIIYDNSNNESLGLLLKDYIDNKIVILIKWLYQYMCPKSGISGQTTQQNHSIYAFKNAKYIGLFDVDEYVNIQKPIKINEYFDNLIKDEKINIAKISSFAIHNKFFYNPDRLPTDGYNFLKIQTCDNVTKGGREKNFVMPKNVETFSVHMVTKGLPMHRVSEKSIFFNHYQFLNKTYRGFQVTNLTDASIMIHIENLIPTKYSV